MVKKLRILKSSPAGKLSRSTVREAVTAIHVYPSVGDRWAVREIAKPGVQRTFRSKDQAIAFAQRRAKQPALLYRTGKLNTVRKTPSNGRTTVLIHDRLGTLKVAPRSKEVVYEVVSGRR
jgi:hypothetical protein